jgi:hypothetical protein
MQPASKRRVFEGQLFGPLWLPFADLELLPMNRD